MATARRVGNRAAERCHHPPGRRGGSCFLPLPCVLPLVPAYLAFLGHEAAQPGVNSHGGRSLRAGPRWRVIRGSVGFVVGLAVFSIAFFYALDRLLSPWKTVVTPVLGVMVILLGLNLMGLIHIGWLSRERRVLPVNRRHGGFGAGFLLGLGLAAGWSPCIGPVLGAVLTSGLNSGTTGQGLYLMTAYCIGLGLPFLLAAILLDRIRPLLRALGAHQRLISTIGGAVVLLMGVLVAFNHFTIFNDWLSAHMPGFFQDPFDL